MSTIDRKGAEIICGLLRVLAEETNEDIYPDDVLADFCGDIYVATMDAIEYLIQNGLEPPLESVAWCARFIRAGFPTEGNA